MHREGLARVGLVLERNRVGLYLERTREGRVVGAEIGKVGLVEGKGAACRRGGSCTRRARGRRHRPAEDIAILRGCGVRHGDGLAPAQTGGRIAIVDVARSRSREARRGTRSLAAVLIFRLEGAGKVICLARVEDLDDIVSDGASVLGDKVHRETATVSAAGIHVVQFAIEHSTGALVEDDVLEGHACHRRGVGDGIAIDALEVLAAVVHHILLGRCREVAVGVFQVSPNLVVVRTLREIGTEGEAVVVLGLELTQVINRGGVISLSVRRAATIDGIAGRVGPGGRGKVIASSGRGGVRLLHIAVLTRRKVDLELLVGAHCAIGICRLVVHVDGLCLPDGVELQHLVSLGSIQVREGLVVGDGSRTAGRRAPPDKLVPAVVAVSTVAIYEIDTGVVKAGIAGHGGGRVGIGVRDGISALGEFHAVLGVGRHGVAEVLNRVFGRLPGGIQGELVDRRRRRGTIRAGHRVFCARGVEDYDRTVRSQGPTLEVVIVTSGLRGARQR